MLGPVNLLRGYCAVEVLGTYPERFLNLCARAGVEFWKTRRLEGGYQLRVRKGAVEQAEELARRCMCVLQVTGRHGAPFAAVKLCRRWAFLAGAAGCVLALFFLGGRVWEFEVNGCEQVPPGRVLRELGALGIVPGVKVSKIDPDRLNDEMILRIPELRWLTVNVNGGIASVELRERTPPPESDAEGGPRNIVAARDGVIDEILASEGQPVVQKGDPVRKGELLISGIVDNNLGARLVRAGGTVSAIIERQFTAVTPVFWKEKTVAERTTPRLRRYYTLIFGRRRINLHFSGSNLYPMCDKIILRKTLTLPDGRSLPLALECAELTSRSSELRERPEAAARAILQQVLAAREAQYFGEREPESRRLSFVREGGLYRMTLTVTSVEEIGVPAEIPADTLGQLTAEE